MCVCVFSSLLLSFASAGMYVGEDRKWKVGGYKLVNDSLGKCVM